MPRDRSVWPWSVSVSGSERLYYVTVGTALAAAMHRLTASRPVRTGQRTVKVGCYPGGLAYELSIDANGSLGVVNHGAASLTFTPSGGGA